MPEPQEMSAPFDLTADMLFVVGFVPMSRLRKEFDEPFLSILGRTPILVWFSTVTEGCYRDRAGRRQCLGGPSQRLYHEITVLAVLRRRSLFCPAIYATSDLSIQIARRYAMPKQAAQIQLELLGGELTSQMSRNGSTTTVVAKIRTKGNSLAAMLRRLWPVWSWPVRFPAGTQVRSLIQDTPRARLAHITSGRLDLPVRWLRSPVRFLGLGLFVPQLRMQLPPPP